MYFACGPPRGQPDGPALESWATSHNSLEGGRPQGRRGHALHSNELLPITPGCDGRAQWRTTLEISQARSRLSE
eukprot:26523-Eustigmatos_ZCMA.PRE.1